MKAILFALSIACFMIGALLTGCADMPVTVGVTSDYGSASYSEKGGLAMEVDASAIERKYGQPPAIQPDK